MPLLRAVVLFFCFFPSVLLASSYCIKPDYRFYLGGLVGYGSTDWSELIGQDEISRASTPYDAGDSGIVRGFFWGYFFSPCFAIEGAYVKFPDTKIFLEDYSFYWPIMKVVSKTDAYYLIGKIGVPVANTGIIMFATVGAAAIQRKDELADKSVINPTFGLRASYDISPRVFTELGFQYYAGYCKAESTPVYDYIPFLYSVHFSLAYRF